METFLLFFTSKDLETI